MHIDQLLARSRHAGGSERTLEEAAGLLHRLHPDCQNLAAAPVDRNNRYEWICPKIRPTATTSAKLR